MTAQDVASIFERQGTALTHWQCIALASRWVIRSVPVLIVNRPKIDTSTAELVDEAGLVLAYLSTLSEAKLSSRGSMEILQQSSDTSLAAIGDLVYDGMMALELKPDWGLGKVSTRLAALANEVASALGVPAEALVERTLSADIAELSSLGSVDVLPVMAVRRVPFPGFEDMEKIAISFSMATNSPQYEVLNRHHEQLEGEGVPSDEVTKIGRKWFQVKTAQRKAPTRKSSPTGAPRNAVASSTIEPDELPKPEVDESPAPDSGKVPELKMESDLPWEVGDADYLGFDAYADALTSLIEFEKTKTPLTIAINAPWGAGKTSLANMIKLRLAQRHEAFPYVIVDFNAWLHDEAVNLGGAFAAEVIRAVDTSRTRWNRFWWPIPWKIRSDRDRKWAIRRIVLLGVLGTACLFSLAWNNVIPLDFRPLYVFVATLTGMKGDASPALGAGALAITLPLVLKAISWVESLTQTLGNYVADPQAAASSGSLSGARNRLKTLIRQATERGRGMGKRTRRIVIFVDDAERCQVPRSIEILEAINQLLSHPNLVTVIMGDMPAIEAAAAIKYKDLANLYNPGNLGIKLEGIANQASYGRQYLQKIIQLQFDVPPHDPDRVKRMMAALASGAQAEEGVQTVTEVPAQPSWWSRLVMKTAALSSGKTETSEATPPQLKLAYRVWKGVSNACLLIFSLSLFYHIFWAVWNGLNWVFSLFSGDANYVGYSFWPGLAIIVFSVLYGLSDDIVKQYREKIDNLEAGQLARKAIAEDRVDFNDIQSTIVSESIATSSEQQERLAAKTHQQVQLNLIGDSQQLVEAYTAAQGYLPMQPRGAKRLLNSLRVMLFVCRVRKISMTVVTPAHLGKWAALRERWPQVAQLILRKPSAIAQLETASAVPSLFKSQIEKLVPDLASDRELAKFFQTEPRLTNVIRCLLHFDPDLVDTKTPRSTNP